ncbi:MAG: hypothetical protein JJLCMIEE_00537 [Acidimicrobiales bacterium]|nr:MAG: transcriptional regulator [Actinomycetota bacterium]MBV6507489.1 hypothetical protein [Acidimicrobiales bacterium]RIK07866.1 MAG: transcriptional regulator [Acidobacteriota bacterium]
MDRETLGATKRLLLEHLKVRGLCTAKDLAGRADVSEVAVRQHLADLERDGLVRSVTGQPSGRGRPAEKWSLTRSADRFFPDRHGDLTVQLIAAVKSAVGEEGFQSVLAARDADQVEKYRSSMAKGSSLDERIEALALARSEEGYMAEVEEAGEGAYRFIENHCPICDAALTCQQLCRSELEVFRSALGEDVTVEREEHMVSGSRRCTYRITG